MKRLLLVLVPMALFAQVVVDTVIRLHTQVGQSFFVPELNKLYLTGPSDFLVLDCSTYQLKARIPVSQTGYSHFSWNWRRQKLYVVGNPYLDSTLVIDAAADSVIGSLKVSEEMFTDVYVSDVDRLYKPAMDTLYEFDCAADTVVRRLMPGGYSTCASWDSVGHKLYVGEGSRKKIYVYDYLADTCIKLIDVSAVHAIMPDAMIFNYSHHKAYVWPNQGEPWEANLGIIDTDLDTLVGVLPVRIWEGLMFKSQVAVDERDGKVYIADCDNDYNTPDTMWVVDCATDSVLKKFQYERRGDGFGRICYVPWSNRIYLVSEYPDSIHNSSLVVVDCNTDSVIVPELLLGNSYIQDIQLDPIHERIFVIGAGDSTVDVLRDTGYGIAEAKPSGPRPASGLQVRTMPGWLDVRYSVAAPCRVDLSVYDLMGREVRRLVAEKQSAGQHSVVWNCQDLHGNRAARGVYFIRLDTPGFRSVKKAVVAR